MKDLSSHNTQAEIVIGLVGATGADLRRFETTLLDLLKAFDYNVNPVKLIDAAKDERIKKSLVLELDESSEYKRLSSLMTAGDKIRQETRQNDFLARWALGLISQARERNSQGSKEQKLSRTAHVLHSIKHPEEVKLLRETYTSGFYLIGVFCDFEQRLKNLTDRGMSKKEAEGLIERDQNELPHYGQKTRNTFHLADVFINLDVSDYGKTQQDIERFLDLMFGNPFLPPTPDEHAMFLAFASSLRSASLARQVGAVITSANGEIIATGANDTPRAGGGQYHPGTADKRDYIFGVDSNTQKRNELIVDVVKRLKPEIASNDKDLLEKGMELLKGSRLLDITEFARDVHAEMEAISSCARVGISTQGATLYTTTFPCHNCTKHIIASGINRVVYVEPYPKSLAEELHGEAIVVARPQEQASAEKVRFEPFVGIGARRYFDLFSLSISTGYEIERKTRDGKKIEWKKSTARLRTPLFPTSYLEREALSIAKLNELIPITSNQSDTGD